CTPKVLVIRIIYDVLTSTGITATAGIGSNLYLCKIAMDIVAKHCEPDENGDRIAELDEISYRKKLWTHKPITDFWRIGNGYAKKLAQYGMYTMGDVARCSIGKPNEFYSEKLLYKLFGVNAELLIDHAWGWEPCTIKEIKSYRPSTNSISSGQVLKTPYVAEKAKLVLREMAEALVLDLVKKKLVTNQIVITVGYDIESLKNAEIRRNYHGDIVTDRYGRKIPKHSHGTVNLSKYMSSSKYIVNAAIGLFDKIVNENLLIRRLCIVANNVISREKAEKENAYEQLDFFTDLTKKQLEDKEMEKEYKLQQAIIKIENKYGKNSILKGMNFLEGATAIERNNQVGGHKA
ncbi:MAG: DNA methylase, partial [Ruminococcus sp.]|nr:DNA methylase [Candidatus Copronaster equi]